jgi:hypothetical protein
MFYVWIALIILGQVKPLWKWVQRNRAKNWPLTSGTIESVTVDEAKRGFFSSSSFGRSPSHIAEINYVYSVGGIGATGIYKRDYYTQDEAWDFVRDLKGKPVAIHYNPDKPSFSALSEPSLETALQNRAPESESYRPTSTNRISPLLVPFLWVFVALSAIGLAVSLYVHLGAVRGQRVVPEPFFWMLHVGIFVVWFPAIYVAKQRIGSLQRKEFLESSIEGFTRMDALYGLRLLWIRSVELRLLPPTNADRFQRRGHTDYRMARILWALDGILFCCAGYLVHGSKLRRNL